MSDHRKGHKRSRKARDNDSNHRNQKRRRKHRNRRRRGREHLREESHGEELPFSPVELVKAGYHPDVTLIMMRVAQALAANDYDTANIFVKDKDSPPLEMSYGWEPACYEACIAALETQMS